METSHPKSQCGDEKRYKLAIRKMTFVPSCHALITIENAEARLLQLFHKLLGLG